MNSIVLPGAIAVAAVIVALMAYRGIQTGGSRFYALEREALLRRAGFTLLGSTLLFLVAISLLVWQNRALQAPVEPSAAEAEAGEVSASADTTPVAPTASTVQDATLDIMPPSRTPLPTEDPNAPTPTPTPIILYGKVTGTGGSGVYMRERPGTDAETLRIVEEGDILTVVIEEAPVEANGFTWVKVRDLGGEEGWVVDFYLEIDE